MCASVRVHLHCAVFGACGPHCAPPGRRPAQYRRPTAPSVSAKAVHSISPRQEIQWTPIALQPWPSQLPTCVDSVDQWDDTGCPSTRRSRKRVSGLPNLSGTLDRVRGRTEPVAHPGLGEQVARVRRIVFELPAYLSHVLAEVVGLRSVLRPPYFLQQLSLADQLARVLRKDLEQPPLGGSEPDLLSGGGLADHMVGEVDGEPTDLYCRDGLLCGGQAAGHRTDAGEQLVHTERLRDVVIRPGVQSRHLVVAPGTPGEHDDRDGRPAAQSLDHFYAVEVREAEIEHHEIWFVACGEPECRRSVGCDVDLILSGPKIDAESTQ